MPSEQHDRRDEFIEVALKRLDQYSERIRLLEQDIRLASTLGLTVTKLAHLIFGNGEAGMAEQIRKILEDVRDLDKQFKEHVAEGIRVREARIQEDKETKKWWTRLLIASVTTTTISVLINTILLWALENRP